MADFGPVKIRFFNFEESAFIIGKVAVYTQPADSYGQTTAIYSGLYPIYLSDLGVPFDFSESVTALEMDGADIPPGTEYIDIEYIPVESGVNAPIDPTSPPAEIQILIGNYYAGGIIQIGAEAGGQFLVMGQQEFGIDTNFGNFTVSLSALEPPAIPAFWTDFKQAIEVIGEE